MLELRDLHSEYIKQIDDEDVIISDFVRDDILNKKSKALKSKHTTPISLALQKHTAIFQSTISQSVALEGIGLHSGDKMRVVIRPAPANHGLVFRRTDIKSAGKDGHDKLFPADFRKVCDTTLCTKLSNAAGHTLSTVEHILAALSGLGIDNALIDVSGAEVPILDGSSNDFIQAILSVGVTPYREKRDFLTIKEKIRVENTHGWAELSPSQQNEIPSLLIKLHIDYPAEAIGQQDISVLVTPHNFIHDIADARTFCMRQDIDMMRKMGLIKGGSLDNAVVVDGSDVLNDEGLRHHDEFVRHKLLDCVGDLALAGRPINGTLTASCTGHALNHLLLKKLFAV